MPQALKGLAVIGIFGITAPITGIDPFVRIQEKDHESQVVIELEQVQVRLLNAGEANLDKPFRLFANFFETDNLPVKFVAIRSGHATEDQHHGFAQFAGLIQPLPITR